MQDPSPSVERHAEAASAAGRVRPIAGARAESWRRTVPRLSAGCCGAVTSAVYSPSGRLVLSGCDHGVVQLLDWTPRGARPLWRGRVDGSVDAVAYAPDGRHFGAGGSRGLMIWDRATGAPCLPEHEHPTHPLVDLAFAPDSRHLAAGATDGNVYVFDVPSGREVAILRVPDPRWANAVAWSPARNLIAAGHGHEISLWAFPAPKPMTVLRGHTDFVLGLAPSPDGRTLASAGRDGTVRVWDVNSGGERLRTDAHPAPVKAIAWDSTGGLLASGGMDGTVRVWDPSAAPQLVDRFEHPGWVESVAFHPGGGSILSVGAAGTISVWSRKPTGAQDH